MHGTNVDGRGRHDGVLRRWRRWPIPASRLYQTGQNTEPLSLAQHRTRADLQLAEITRPEQSLTSWQPVVRIDYQPWTALRARSSAAWGQPAEPILGSMPGFNDTQMNDPVARSGRRR